jgi:hypothetical protein
MEKLEEMMRETSHVSIFLVTNNVVNPVIKHPQHDPTGWFLCIPQMVGLFLGLPYIPASKNTNGM